MGKATGSIGFPSESHWIATENHRKSKRNIGKVSEKHRKSLSKAIEKDWKSFGEA